MKHASQDREEERRLEKVEGSGFHLPLEHEPLRSLSEVDQDSNETPNRGSVAAEPPRPAPVGSWQCQHCHLTSMRTWRGSPNPEDAPACCGGELMLPYRIPQPEALVCQLATKGLFEDYCVKPLGHDGFCSPQPSHSLHKHEEAESPWEGHDYAEENHW